MVKGENQLNIGFSSTEGTFVILPIPFDKGWKILVNGIETTFFNVNAGTIGFKVPAGQNEIQMFFYATRI